jgi:hypothetical protein
MFVFIPQSPLIVDKVLTQNKFQVQLWPCQPIILAIEIFGGLIFVFLVQSKGNDLSVHRRPACMLKKECIVSLRGKAIGDAAIELLLFFGKLVSSSED